MIRQTSVTSALNVSHKTENKQKRGKKQSAKKYFSDKTKEHKKK